MLENTSCWKTDLTENQIYLGYTFEDLERLEKYQTQSEVENGFYTDYFGIKTDLSFFLFTIHIMTNLSVGSLFLAIHFMLRHLNISAPSRQ